MKLIIQNKEYNKAEILAIEIDAIKQEYIKEIILFLRQWWSNSDFIVAQTSGSTGKPKSIQLKKNSMRISGKATGLFFQHPKKICSPLSARFIAGKMMLVRALEWNAEIHCIPPSINPLKDIDQNYDFMVMTPHQLQNGLDSKLQNRIAKLRVCLLGGSPLQESLELKLQKLTCQFYLGYGMTETMSHVALRPINGINKSKYYKAVDGIDFSTDNRTCLQINTNGLLHEPLITNDIVELIDNQHFIWRSRFDDVINTGGIKVFPLEIEKIIKELIAAPFYIVGKKHHTFGQQVTLYIEDKPWTDTRKENLLLEIKNLVESYSRPKEIIVIDQFEYTENGKLRRIVL